jgi:hypothetical protein
VPQPAFATGAIKHYILIELLPGADQLALDRWYMTFHAPQVRRPIRPGGAITSRFAPICRRKKPCIGSMSRSGA